MAIVAGHGDPVGAGSLERTYVGHVVRMLPGRADQRRARHRLDRDGPHDRGIERRGRSRVRHGVRVRHPHTHRPRRGDRLACGRHSMDLDVG